MRRLLISVVAALLGVVGAPVLALAAAPALTTATLHMRAGPGTEYPVVDTIPDGAQVYIHGCIRDYSWCDVSWDGERGWAFAMYLEAFYHQRYVPVPAYSAEIDIPLIGFALENYWGEYYRHRPWYRRRFGIERGRYGHEQHGRYGHERHRRYGHEQHHEQHAHREHHRRHEPSHYGHFAVHGPISTVPHARHGQVRHGASAHHERHHAHITVHQNVGRQQPRQTKRVRHRHDHSARKQGHVVRHAGKASDHHHSTHRGRRHAHNKTTTGSGH